MANAGQLGIKQLLEAEGKAQEIVNNARKAKQALLKQARDDAEREIKEYYTTRQNEFDQYQKQHLAGTGTYAQQLAVTTDTQIKSTQEAIEKNRDKVIDLLLNFTSEVYTEVAAK